MNLEGRMDKMDRRLDATLKIVQTGMKMLVKMQEGMREMKEDTRQFKTETRQAINALIAAQQRSDARLDRFIASLGRSGTNGHSHR
jgi:hypothetical protein